jgi:hypothetical protein
MTTATENGAKVVPISATQAKAKPTPKAPQNRGQLKRMRRVKAQKEAQIPGVTVVKPGEEAPPRPDIVYLDEEDCALASAMVMKSQEFQLHVGGLLKGLGKDRSVEWRLVIMTAVLAPATLTQPTPQEASKQAN